jgi:ATP-dependent Clp endopeptidase proteolytic subunit ClpP
LDDDYFWAAGRRKSTPTPPPLPVQTSPTNVTRDKDHIVEIVNNTIYFYSEVSRPKILELNKGINNLSTNLINQTNMLKTQAPGNIYLHINSFGGSVFAGLSAVDTIQASSVPVCTLVEGCAASAATLMSIVGTRRAMRQNAFMLIHQLSSGMWGKYEEQKDQMQNNDLLMEVIKGLYEKHTNIPKKKLREMLKRDLWFDAETCLEYGLVDEII